MSWSPRVHPHYPDDPIAAQAQDISADRWTPESAWLPMMWDDGNWDATSWLAITLMLLVLLWGGLAVMVAGRLRNSRAGSTSSTGGQQGSSGHADEILAARFVRGEIDEAELTRQRQALHSTRGRCGRVDQS